MEKQEIKQRLADLTPRELEVMGLLCKGLDYSQIAERLVVTRRAVRAHTSNLIRKLGLRKYTVQQRKLVLLDEVCPVLEDGDIQIFPQVPEETIDEDLTPEEEEMVDELEYALVKVEPIVFNGTEVVDNGNGKESWFLRNWRFLVGVAIGVLVTYWAIQLFSLVGGTTSTSGDATNETVSTQDTLPSAEDQQEVSMQTPEPTPTAIPPTPTNTSQPTETPLPLPFEDDFNTGAKSEWEEIAGRWRMIEGAYAADRTGNWNVSLVGSESWTPSVIEVDAITDNWNWPVRVIVREYEGSFLILQTNCCDTEFILVEGGEEFTIGGVETGGLTGSIFWNTNHLRIEIDGTIYTVYVDGNQLLSVQEDTFTSGRVGLGLNYDARFDNFEVR